jgi:hypothetical protein
MEPCSADDQSLELKPPTKPKKFRISYAAVVGRGRKKQHTPSNHRAYKAWEERKGKGMGTVKPDKAPASEPKLSLPEKKIEGFRTWVGRRKMKGVSNCNRLPMVSKVIT